MPKLATSLVVAAALCACGTTASTSDGGTGGATGGSGGTSGGTSGGGDAGGQPIGNLPTEQWTWVPVDGALCRDGSATGIGVNYNPASTKLMIFLEGGGACFNVLTCASNPSTFGQTDFQAAFGAGGSEASAGIFDRADSKNPVADWSFVYVPYCTGDLHGGNIPDGGTTDGLGPEAFVGYHNVALDLARVVPTFPHLTEVLLTGASAGGFGSLLNYDQVAAAFGAVPVELLDDSGPPMSTDYLAPCLQELVTQTWNLAATIVADCGAACQGDGGFALPYLQHVAGSHPDRAMGLADSTHDGVISDFFGIGLSNCAGGSAMPPAMFEQGLLDIRTEMASYPNFGLFAFPGTDHTSLEDSNFDSRVAGDAGYPLTTWTADIVDGGVLNVGP